MYNKSHKKNCICPPVTSIPFLDTFASVKGDQIILNLYKEPTDRWQYLLTMSTMPSAHVTDNIQSGIIFELNM